MSLTDTFVDALKAGAAGAANEIFGKKDFEPTTQTLTPTPLGMGGSLPSWALPAAGAVVVALVLLRK